MMRGDGTGVLVALQHHLGVTSDRVPELDAAIFGTTHDPVSIRSQTHAEHKVLFQRDSRSDTERHTTSNEPTYLMTFEGSHAFAGLDTAVGIAASGNAELPKLDGLVETATDKVAAIGSEGDRVNAILVTLGVLQTFHQVAGGGIPDADALVQRTGGDVVAIGRHRYRGHAVLDAQSVDQLALHDIPESHGLVAATGRDVPTISGEVKGVDILLVAAEDVLDGSRSDIPNLYRNISLEPMAKKKNLIFRPLELKE